MTTIPSAVAAFYEFVEDSVLGLPIQVAGPFGSALVLLVQWFVTLFAIYLAMRGVLEVTQRMSQVVQRASEVAVSDKSLNDVAALASSARSLDGILGTVALWSISFGRIGAGQDREVVVLPRTTSVTASDVHGSRTARARAAMAAGILHSSARIPSFVVRLPRSLVSLNATNLVAWVLVLLGGHHDEMSPMVTPVADVLREVLASGPSAVLAGVTLLGIPLVVFNTRGLSARLEHQKLTSVSVRQAADRLAADAAKIARLAEELQRESARLFADAIFPDFVGHVSGGRCTAYSDGIIRRRDPITRPAASVPLYVSEKPGYTVYLSSVTEPWPPPWEPSLDLTTGMLRGCSGWTVDTLPDVTVLEAHLDNAVRRFRDRVRSLDDDGLRIQMFQSLPRACRPALYRALDVTETHQERIGAGRNTGLVALIRRYLGEAADLTRRYDAVTDPDEAIDEADEKLRVLAEEMSAQYRRRLLAAVREYLDYADFARAVRVSGTSTPQARLLTQFVR